jgi:hypothetical protein
MKAIKNRDFLDDEALEIAKNFAEAAIRQSQKVGGDWSPIEHIAETMLALLRVYQARWERGERVIAD